MYALGLQFKLINDFTKLTVEELLVKITGSSSGATPYLSIYFSKKGYECQHNLNYWKAQDWLGIGPGAHSRFDHQGQRVGLAPRRNPKSWLEMTAHNGHAIETESIDTLAEWASEILMMGLRLKVGVDLDVIERKCGPRHLWLNQDRIAMHVEDGLLQFLENKNGAHLATTADGRLLLNSLLADIIK